MARAVGVDTFKRIIEAWGADKSQIAQEQWLTYDRGLFIGIDNTTGDCWVEQFETEGELIAWLEGSEGMQGSEIQKSH